MYAISVSNLEKKYNLYENKIDKLREIFSFSKKKYHREFKALESINFDICKGEAVGIIGTNGSGKSTLLKILSGIINQSNGEVFIDGRVSALLELGAGFNPEYTGLENIFLNSMLMGYSKEDTVKKLDDILKFADIGDFINQPVKNYSSGMFVRLAFSIAINVEPDILIIDEALSVGDIFFQKKCYKKIKELAGRSTVLIVSHDLNALTKFCDRLILLNDGSLVFDGNSKEAIKEFYRIKQGSLKEKADMKVEKTFEDFKNANLDEYSGRMNAIIYKYHYSVNGIPFIEAVKFNDIIKVSFLLKVNDYIRNPIVGYQINDKYATEIFGETTFSLNEDLYELSEGVYLFEFEFNWPEIREGDYFLTIGVGDGVEVLNQIEECWLNNCIHFINSTDGKVIFGIFNNEFKSFNYIKEDN